MWTLQLENQQSSHHLFELEGGDGSPKCELQHMRVSNVKYSFSAGSSPFRTTSLSQCGCFAFNAQEPQYYIWQLPSVDAPRTTPMLVFLQVLHFVYQLVRFWWDRRRWVRTWPSNSGEGPSRLQPCMSQTCPPITTFLVITSLHLWC